VSDLHPDLDPATGALLSFLAAAGAPPMWEQTPEEARQGFRTLAVDLRDDSLLPPVRAVEEIEVPGGAGPRPARVYRPEHDGPLPTVLFLHGGGFVIGDLDTHDLACRTIAVESRAVVVSVDYRLAPEHPFPAAVEDTLAAADWMVGRLEELGGSDRTGVAGDSAGGNLAAVAAQHLRDAGHALTAQLLIYPATDMGAETESARENAEGYFLDAATMAWFGDQYAGPGGADAVDLTDPRLSPAHGDLTGLAPAVVVTAQFDPLRDDGDAYARKLEAAGVPVHHRQFAGLIHGFVDMGRHSPAADEAVRETCRLFGELLHT
jgi:acetyl esterase